MSNKKQVEKNHYFNKKYDSKNRIISYWQQIEEVKKCNPESILEIGIGNKFVSDYLKKHNYNIKTMDIDPDLEPDKVGSVTDIPFEDNSFDCVLCCEVLEHIPFNQFRVALKEINRVAKRRVILSIPDASRKYRFLIQIPKIGEIKFLIPIPRLKKLEHKFDGEHYWEIGKRNYSLGKIKDIINNVNGLKLEKTYELFENAYHRFFILKVIN
ncbi:MAG: methyltransferase type 11 [Candidatus Frackibacter sp. T328-2]|jgi:SAM-dependent methyltransferase|nr:MAG: methyltransferase type 11 [Candidatus Frackibacter sp. T328-2]